MSKGSINSAKQLLDRYNAGASPESEKLLVEAWFNQQIKNSPEPPKQEDLNIIGQEIWDRLPEAIPHKRQIWLKIAAAIILVVFGVSLIYLHKDRQNNLASLNKDEAIIPGSFGATLTLGNGKTIKLNKQKNVVLANEAGVSIRKTSDGQLSYEAGASSSSPSSNTLTTSKGETFEVALPDGSYVWLNAGSSLTYSTDIAVAQMRSVKLSGEAYFKVAKNPRHPFVVTTPLQKITVLGTEFNVNSYGDDEEEITTLLNGRVSMATPVQEMILMPGEQGIVSKRSINKTIANTSEAIGWKDNQFVFASRDIKSIMKLIARWYNVEVVYQGNIPTEKISGRISRFANIDNVLNILKATGVVSIRQEGRVIILSEHYDK